MVYSDSAIRLLGHVAPGELAQEITRLRRALWECLVLSGADVSGYDGPENWPTGESTPLEERAVRGVRELRADYEETL